MKFSAVYKKDLIGNIRYRQVEVEGNKYRTYSGIVGREATSEQVTEWTYTGATNVGRANEMTAEEQALRLKDRIYQIAHEQGYYDTVEEAGKGTGYFQPMLAQKWYGIPDKKRRKMFYEYDEAYLQPKLDGIRCIVNRDGMWSRHGKLLVSAPHIFAALQPVFEKYPDAIFDGELYSHDLNRDFNKIISLARKTKPTVADLEESAQNIQYWMYDFPGALDLPFVERYQELYRIANNFKLEETGMFKVVDTEPVSIYENIDEYLEACLEDGYEGAILRFNQPYECKRSKNLMKLKKFEDGEFPIVRIEEGKGNLTGVAGRVIVDVNGKEVSSGLKFSREDARSIWENRGRLIGKTATIRYFNVTEDGSLRFPKCVDIAREDYE